MSSANDPTLIRSSGKVAPVWRGIPLRVNGSKIVDGLGREVRLKGFNLWSSDIFENWNMPLTVEHFKQIKAWGFNVVRNTGWWGNNFEPNYSQVGLYDEKSLASLEKTVVDAREAGLYYIISIRVSYNDTHPVDWQGWGKANYVHTEEGLDRFSRLWEMLVQRFDNYTNVIGYCPWHFPWHQTDYSEEDANKYYEVVTPRLIQAIRKHSSKIIFWAPIGAGKGVVDGVSYHSGQYASINPILDENIVYMHNVYSPRSVTHEGESWDYNVDFLEAQISFAVNFSRKYNVPLIAGEFGINWHKYSKDQTRLDWLDAVLKLFERYGYNWLNWIYSTPASGGWGILNEDGTPTEVVDVLRKYSLGGY